MNHQLNFILFLFLLFSIRPAAGHHFKGQHYLVNSADAAKGQYWHKKLHGNVAITADKRPICITDTLRTYSIVLRPDSGFVAIDRQGNFLYKVFLFDNGPDYPAEGLFRIVANNKIGFASAKTGRIIIPPQYGCAYPFENGKAEVSIICQTILESDGEHHVWAGKNWFYINRKGQRISSTSTPKAGRKIQRKPLPRHESGKLRPNR